MDGKISRGRLLVVDDSADTRELLERNLISQGYEVLTAADVGEALRILGSSHVDLVITDLKMPGASGFDLMRHVRENLKETEVMIITGYPSVEGAVAAVKSGAEEYLSKPFTKEELFGAVGRAVEKLNLRRAGRAYTDRQISNPLGMVAESEAMQQVFKAVFRAASTKTSVLITGEDGTGKELLAKAIHYTSPRATAPFVTLNCAGNPEEFLERQLFGFITGPSQGGRESQVGFLEFVDSGTLYFKEISELPYAIQSRLCRVLEGKEYLQAESPENRPANFVMMAGSKKDLKALVNEGAFHEDLFVRLSMNTIVVPALRERGNDVLILAQHFLNRFSKEVGRSIAHFSDHAMEVIRSYSWPGNIGELQNIIHQLVLTTETDVIDVPDFPSHMRFSVAGAVNLNRSLAEVEAEHIRGVIASVGGNKTRAAEILGINRKTLREKLRQMGLPESNL